MAQLERKLGLLSCITIVVGGIIGSSIFMKPAIMAQQVHLPLLLLFTWIITGFVSMIGSMITAELGAMLPVTGGQYVFLKYSFGNLIAFLNAWAGLIVFNTAAIGAGAFLFAQYTEYFIQLPHFDAATEHSIALTIPFIGKFYLLENFGIKMLAVFILLLLTYINVRTVRGGAAIQNISTIMKVAAIALLAFGILFSGKGNVQNFYDTYDDLHYSFWQLTLGFVAAASGALGAYDGWNMLGYLGGEIKNPQKNIPRGIIIGITICIIAYVLTSEAYLYMLPVNEMQHSSLVATDAFAKAFGNSGGALIAALVIITVFGALNGNIIPCARLTFAMSEERIFFPMFGKVHSKYHSPANALWLQFALSAAFVIIGSFDSLVDMFVFATWVFYGFLGISIIILRKKMKDAERPYKMWGYPYLPIIFILFAAFYFVFTIYNDVSNYISGKSQVINSLFGLVLVCTGIPLYLYCKKRYGLKQQS